SIPLAREQGACRPPQVSWLPALADRLDSVRWCGYLSSTAVYGDAGGAWVDESTPCVPESARGRARLAAEQAWLASGLPAEVFRIAGIYGPGRNLIAKLRAGGYRAVRWQPPRWSNRIHVDDIVSALMAAMHKPKPGRIVNLADDLPLPHDEYVTELAERIGASPPIILTPVEAEEQLSPAMLDFFHDSKRVSNQLLHRELLPRLRYPDFRSAIDDLLRAEDADG
ncbi:MAG: SDR family NAD(P)-dependent oxidoreductase, partial [Gammaproteobacteria bacterium]